MSKYAEALEKLQKQHRSAETSSDPAHSIFAGTLHEKLRKPSRVERFLFILSKARLVIIAACSLLSAAVFFFGVQQGMKIERVITAGVPVSRTKAFTETPRAAKAVNTPRPRAAAPKAAASTGPLTLQLISYKSQSRADQEIAKLKAGGYEAFRIRQGKYYHVCAGRFQTRADGAALKERMEDDGTADAYPGAFVRNAL
jgi:hypothetical protein